MPTYTPMSQEKIIVTLQRVSLMSIEHIYQFGASIQKNIRMIREIGGYPQQQLDEHLDWLHVLIDIVFKIRDEVPIDYAKIELQLRINSLLRHLEITDPANHHQILAELEQLERPHAATNIMIGGEDWSTLF